MPCSRDLIKVDKVRALRESVKRLSLSPDCLPSAVCYTLVNGHGGVTALDITDDSTLLAVGFADSHIRVYALNDQQLRRMKPADQIEVLEPSAGRWRRRTLRPSLYTRTSVRFSFDPRFPFQYIRSSYPCKLYFHTSDPIVTFILLTTLLLCRLKPLTPLPM